MLLELVYFLRKYLCLEDVVIGYLHIKMEFSSTIYPEMCGLCMILNCLKDLFGLNLKF